MQNNTEDIYEELATALDIFTVEFAETIGFKRTHDGIEAEVYSDNGEAILRRYHISIDIEEIV